MKKILSFILAVTMLITGFVFAFAAQKGDVDGDGQISASDARLALRFSVGLDEPSEEQKGLADYDGNGEVQAADARLILRRSVGLEEEVEDEDEGEQLPTQTPEQKPVQKPVQKPSYTPSERELNFYNTLYETAHPLLGSYPAMFDNAILKNFQKWCCLYTINYVFRPALEKSGYSKSEINLLAPNTFSRDSIAKLISNATGISWSDKFVVDTLPLYVPSLLADYYLKNEKASDVYILYDFYDDMIENKVYEHSDEDRANYSPRVGDVLFISNKTKTYINGYPTVDHTAQIIKVYDDGTFLCSEGSLLDPDDPTGLARVQERRYMYDAKTGSYCYINADKTVIWRHIVVLFAAQPKLTYR